MWLHDLLKADKLVELYSKESSFFHQPDMFYITFNDIDPDFEFRLMINHILEPSLECKICKQKQAAVRVIYRTKTVKKVDPIHQGNWPAFKHIEARYEESSSYKWAYICSTECLEMLRSKILMAEVKETNG